MQHVPSLDQIVVEEIYNNRPRVDDYACVDGKFYLIHDGQLLDLGMTCRVVKKEKQGEK